MSAIGLYRVAEDALTGMLAATSGGRIELEVSVCGRMVTMRIASTGKRADTNPDPAASKLELLAMHHRAESIGGQLRRDMLPVAGVAVTVELELAAQ